MSKNFAKTIVSMTLISSWWELSVSFPLLMCVGIATWIGLSVADKKCSPYRSPVSITVARLVLWFIFLGYFSLVGWNSLTGIRLWGFWDICRISLPAAFIAVAWSVCVTWFFRYYFTTSVTLSCAADSPESSSRTFGHSDDNPAFEGIPDSGILGWPGNGHSRRVNARQTVICRSRNDAKPSRPEVTAVRLVPTHAPTADKELPMIDPPKESNVAARTPGVAQRQHRVLDVAAVMRREQATKNARVAEETSRANKRIASPALSDNAFTNEPWNVRGRQHANPALHRSVRH